MNGWPNESIGKSRSEIAQLPRRFRQIKSASSYRIVSEVIVISHRESIELALQFDEVIDTALELEAYEEKLGAKD